MTKPTILITGGHLTPALALIEYIQSCHPDLKPVFVGRLYSQDRSQQLSQEKTEVEQRGVKFIPFTSARLSGGLAAVTQLGTFIKSLLQAQRILIAERPVVVVSFGGYLAVPVALMAWLYNIPIVTHEQTRTIGFATQVIGWLARYVAVSFPETMTELPTDKAVLVGNPLRQELLSEPDLMVEAPTARPLLYVTGGNQGSTWINQMILNCLPEISQEWAIVHQCGNATADQNYRAQLEAARQQLPPDRQRQYLVKEWLTTSEVAWIYRHATAVVSRAGANTIQELQYFALPALLIPLPFSRRQEQQLNAEHLVKLGGALSVDQNQTSPAQFLAGLAELKQQAPIYRTHLQSHPVPTDAAARLWAVIAETLPKETPTHDQA